MVPNFKKLSLARLSQLIPKHPLREVEYSIKEQSYTLVQTTYHPNAVMKMYNVSPRILLLGSSTFRQVRTYRQCHRKTASHRWYVWILRLSWKDYVRLELFFGYTRPESFSTSRFQTHVYLHSTLSTGNTAFEGTEFLLLGAAYLGSMSPRTSPAHLQQIERNCIDKKRIWHLETFRNNTFLRKYLGTQMKRWKRIWSDVSFFQSDGTPSNCK